MNVLQHTRNELNLCLKENRPDRSYRDTLLSVESEVNWNKPWDRREEFGMELVFTCKEKGSCRLHFLNTCTCMNQMNNSHVKNS